MEFNLDWQPHTSALWPEVTYELRPLKVWAFQALLDCWDGAQGWGGAGGAGGAGPVERAPRPAAAGSARLMEAAERVFPEHVRNLAGLTVRAEGRVEPAGLEHLSRETLLLPLAGEIIARLLSLSEVGEAAEKN
jgi:hypothetical protein